MNILFPHREANLVEKMDAPDCDLQKLNKTYQYFLSVNRTLGRWKFVYKTMIRPIAKETGSISILDIGCGGGDILMLLTSWLKQDGIVAKCTGIDPDSRAIAFAKSRTYAQEVNLIPCTSSDLVENKQKFDIVISNHILHHLTDDEIKKLLMESIELADKKVIHCDLVRNDIAYLSYPIVSWPAHFSSFLMEDGLISIRRSFRCDEISSIAGKGWKVQPIRPFRYALLWEAK